MDQLSGVGHFGYAGQSSTASVETNTTGGGDNETRALLAAVGVQIGEARHDFAQHRYVLIDAEGSTVLSINNAGGVMASFDYDTYGTPVPNGTGISSESADEKAQTPYQYRGGRTHSHAGLIDFGGENYAPALRVWVAPPQHVDSTDDLEQSENEMDDEPTMDEERDPGGTIDEEPYRGRPPTGRGGAGIVPFMVRMRHALRLSRSMNRNHTSEETIIIGRGGRQRRAIVNHRGVFEYSSRVERQRQSGNWQRDFGLMWDDRAIRGPGHVAIRQVRRNGDVYTEKRILGTRIMPQLNGPGIEVRGYYQIGYVHKRGTPGDQFLVTHRLFKRG